MIKPGDIADTLICGWFNVQDFSAPSNYVVGFAKALTLAGRRVAFLLECDPPEAPAQPGGYFEHRGFPFIAAGARPPMQRNLGLCLAAHWGPNNPTLCWLRQADLRGIRHIITYSGYSAVILRLDSFLRRRGICFHNIVGEWYGLNSFSFPKDILNLLDSEFQRRYANRSVGNLIVLTRYLETYYRRGRCRTELVPPLVDGQDRLFRESRRNRKPKIANQLRLVFSGSADRDRQDVILAAILAAVLEGHDIRIDYLGSKKEAILKAYPSVTKAIAALGDRVRFHGRLPAAGDVYQKLAEADFSILLRDVTKWSSACFPSRIPELFALGVPIITNRHSDIWDYLSHGADSIQVVDSSRDALANALRRACQMTAAEHEAMSQNAFDTLRARFSPAAYQANIGRFLADCEAHERKALGEIPQFGRRSSAALP